MDRVVLSQEIGSLFSSFLDGVFSDCTITVAILDSIRADVKLPFIMAAVDIPSSVANRTDIFSILHDIFGGFLDSNYAGMFGGLEVIFRHKGSMRRIVRVSVTTAGYKHILQFQVSDFDKPGPFLGVGCWVYDTALA
jgi:hypothetical protein